MGGMKDCPKPQCEIVTEHGAIAEFRDETEFGNGARRERVG